MSMESLDQFFSDRYDDTFNKYVNDNIDDLMHQYTGAITIFLKTIYRSKVEMDHNDVISDIIMDEYQSEVESIMIKRRE